MRGSIFKRKGSKTYTINVSLGRDPTTGKYLRDWYPGFRTYKDAQKALTELLRNLDTGNYVRPTRQTLAEFTEEWLLAIRGTVRPTTFASYEAVLRCHVLPKLGNIELASLSAKQLNTRYAELLRDGRVPKTKRPDERDPSARTEGSGGLSVRTVRYVHTIVHRLLRDATKWGAVVRNAAAAADPPKASSAKRTEIVTWSADELRAFHEGAQSERLYAAWYLASTTGMRRGEVLGLPWANVDLDAGTVAITQQLVTSQRYEKAIHEPKTRKGRRVIGLDTGTVMVLRSWWAQQARERLKWGSGWTDTGLVFTREDGTMLDPNWVSKLFEKVSVRLGLPRIRFHDLRHTHATIALRAGVHPKVVSERLGHGSVALTLDVYSHVTAGMDADAAERIASRVSGR